MNLQDFISLLTSVASRRKVLLSHHSSIKVDGYKVGMNHARFDLDRTKIVLAKMEDSLSKRKHSLVDKIIEVKRDLC